MFQERSPISYTIVYSVCIILYRFCVYVQRQEEMIPKHEYFQIFGTSYMMNNKKEKVKT